ncbi:unnamed protein product [Penicillium olsonii]|nr:unnamed protein product [Penicillium olsonii]CAG7925812.1 unnamed protein product [Penicillium olsonii]
MLSHGRPCLRRRLPAVLDTVATGTDPLLFLYPRWVTPALRQRRFFLGIPAPTSRCQASSTPCRPSTHRCPSFARHSCRWISNTPDRASNPSSASPQTKKNEYLDEEGFDEIFGHIDSTASDANQVAVSHADTNSPPWHPSQIPFGAFLQKRARRVHASVSSTKEQSMKRKQKAQEEAAAGISHEDQKRKQTRYHMKQFYNRVGKHYIDRAWLDSRDVLEDLQKQAQLHMKVAPKGREIYVSEEVLAALCGVNKHSFGDNVWHLLVNNGCRVHVLPESQNKGPLRRVALHGTERAQDIAEAQFNDALESQERGKPSSDFRKTMPPICASSQGFDETGFLPPLVRGTWHLEDPVHPPTFEKVIAKSGVIKSVREFTEHVEDVVTSRLKTIPEKIQSGSRGAQEQKQIAEYLMGLFDTHQKYLSTSALHLALEWLCKSAFRSTARALCTRSQQVATLGTYHIMLEDAAKLQDIIGFRNVLQEMGRAKISPSPDTWLIVLGALVKPDEKALLVAHMAQNGYLSDINIVRGALLRTIQNSLRVHLHSGEDIKSYLDLMVNTWGANWFTSRLLHQMFETASREKNFVACEDLAEICLDQHLMVDHYSLSALIQAFRADIYRAVHYTIRFLDIDGFRMSSATYEYLFLGAFKARHYNICRVVWHYACLSNNVTYKMKQTVLVGLCNNVSSSMNDIGKLWKIDAGKVISGVPLNHENPTTPHYVRTELPPGFKGNPAAHLAQWKPMGAARTSQIRLANALLRQDMTSGSHYKPKYPLQLMLDAAAHMDSDWHDVPHRLSWKMENAIQIPLYQKPLEPPEYSESLDTTPESLDIFTR